MYIFILGNNSDDFSDLYRDSFPAHIHILHRHASCIILYRIIRGS